MGINEEMNGLKFLSAETRRRRSDVNVQMNQNRQVKCLSFFVFFHSAFCSVFFVFSTYVLLIYIVRSTYIYYVLDIYLRSTYMSTR